MPVARPGIPVTRSQLILGTACALVLAVLAWWWWPEATLAHSLAESVRKLQAWQLRAPWAYALAFCTLFTLLSAAALPGCAILALLAGDAFGWLGGTALVGLCSTLGAVMSFLLARFLVRDQAQRRFGRHLAWLEQRLSVGRGAWLFWLRLVPLLPYPVLNPVLGLSQMPLGQFLWPSLAGLTLGSLPYVLAGSSLAPWLAGHGGPNLALAGLAATLLLATAAITWAARRRNSVRPPQ